MSTETEFRSGVREYLERLTNSLVPVLAQLIAYEYPKEVVSLDFEVFPDSFTDGFPVRAFFMDSTNSEFFEYENSKAKYPSPVDPALLKIDCVYPYEFEEHFTSRDENLDTFMLASSELIEWFSMCWTKAGGDRFSRRASIMIHDDIRTFNLNKGVWEE